MKFSRVTRLFLSGMSIFVFLTASAKPQRSNDDIQDLAKGYYLVVGAFKIKKNAVRYSSFINKKGETSEIGRNPDKDHYYVYVFSSMDLELIKSKWVEYRLQNEFAEAWVFKNKMPEEVKTEPFVAEDSQEIFEDPAESEEQPAPTIDIPEPVTQTESAGFRYVFNVINSTTLKEVPGFVSVVDVARNKVFTSVETNVPVEIPDPGTKTKEVIFICDVFGYVKQQVKLKLDAPEGSPEVSTSDDGTFVVNFELVRHKPGDILTMFYVFFYNDAAIMKPESKFELNSLLDMLKENENLQIKIHGHTNGNSPGKIIKLRDDDNNFFEVTGNNIEMVGSAKDLSTERANVIRRWLIAQGIDEKRMSLKGWGGKKMIYDKKSEHAAKNVRVEVEILKD